MSTYEMVNSWSVVILTGGTSKRFGSDKSEALINERALIDHVIDAIPVDVPVIVVGPDRAEFPSRVQVTQEDPIHGGPVAGFAAGLSHVTTEFVALLATDMPNAASAIPQLLAHITPECDVVLAVDSQGFRQPFCGMYRVPSVFAALSRSSSVHGESMRNLLAGLGVVEIALAQEALTLIDIDTPEDLIAAQDNLRHVNTKES